MVEAGHWSQKAEKVRIWESERSHAHSEVHHAGSCELPAAQKNYKH